MPTFFNPAANLTANRIPYALGGGRLGDSLLSVSAGNVALPSNQYLEFGTYLGQSKIVYETPGVVGLALYSGGAVRMKIANGGEIILGPQANALNGLLQPPSHTTAGGGYGFYDFSLYRDGAGSLRTNASAFRVDGQILPGYGTFAAPALAPGDSGNGLYCIDPGGGRVTYIKGYGGRVAFRKSDDSGNTLALSDGYATMYGQFNATGAILSDAQIVAGTQFEVYNGVGNVKVVGQQHAGWGAAPGDGVQRSLSAASSQSDHNDALRAPIAALHAGAGVHGLLKN